MHLRFELLSQKAEHLYVEHETLGLLVCMSRSQRLVAECCQYHSEGLGVQAVLFYHGVAADHSVLLRRIVVDLSKARPELVSQLCG